MLAARPMRDLTTFREGHRGLRVDIPVLAATEHAHLGDASLATALAAGQVHDDVEGCGELAVHGSTAEAGRDRKRLEPRRDVGRVVRVQGAATSLVAGVQGRQKIDDFAAAHLTDDEAVGPHA